MTDNIEEFTNRFNATEYHYWKHEHPPDKLPKYRFYTDAKDLHGKKGSGWSGRQARVCSSSLRNIYVKELGFRVLDEFVITAGRIDNYGTYNDGWHFWGTMKQMDNVIFFNLLCNDWLVNVAHGEK